MSTEAVTDSYFKRGAKIRPAVRRAVTEANMVPSAPHGEARAIALANLHKPWARRYLRQFGYVS